MMYVTLHENDGNGTASIVYLGGSLLQVMEEAADWPS